MATEIEALETIIEWDAELGRMAILNPGDVAEVSDSLAKAKIEAGAAAKPGKKRGKAEKTATEQPAPVEEAATVEEAPAADAEPAEAPAEAPTEDEAPAA